jgi:saccharopine dehydrogenase-like NADP-dependent oxidoreductase
MAKQQILVLGCGMIGSAVAMDLARHQWDVTVADCDAGRLARLESKCKVASVMADVSDPDRVKALARHCKVVIAAVPSAMAFRTLRAILEAARHAVCISFMPEDARALTDLARQNGVAVVIDCGVAPGLSNMLVGSAASSLSSCERVDIYVGGLPVERTAPFEYKAGFSPYDVIEEYVDPSKVVENGKIVVKPALSDIELLTIPGVGELEAFLTDGLRTLIDTIGAPFMQEKTLRYPGHAQAMVALRDAGFFWKEPVRVGDGTVRPLDVTAAMLFPRWAYRDDEPDLTVLRVAVSGRAQNEHLRFTWDLIDRYDPETGLRSMSRTTAFPATIVAGLVADGAFPVGVNPPEVIGQLGLLEHVLDELDRRGVHCQGKVERQPGV